MKNISIDIGNTRYKVGFFDENNLIETLSTKEENEIFAFVNHLFEKNFIENIIIASVKADLADFIAKLSQNKTIKNIFFLSADLPIPLKNHYQTPKTLGTDRIAGMCGAKALFPQKNCLVIDIGTCITYDLIDKNDNFFGGTISPGVRMRLRAMHEFTQKLPLLNWTSATNQERNQQESQENNFSENFPNIQGNSTKDAMFSGAINGVMMEIQGIILHFEHLYEDLQIILCGGDAFYFEKSLKGTIFAHPKLVLYGLNRILQHNVQKK